MKNKELWKPTHYNPDRLGKMTGTHMHKIIGYAYEKRIRQYATGVLADVGCGLVPYYSIYKDLVDDVICIDWDQEGTGVSFLDHIADLNKGVPLESEIA